MAKLPDAPKASSPETRMRMQAVGRRDTPPELAIRSALHRAGFRFRVDTAPLKSIRRRADIVFAPAKVAVFVDGCFWHGCPLHMTWPKSNKDWWRQKIKRNRQRDLDTDQRLSEAGWKVVRVWAHEDPKSVAEKVARLVEQHKT